MKDIAQALSGRSRGLFIAFEGGDGSGKTSQLHRLAAELAEASAPVLAAREPGGTELGQQLRTMVLHGPEDVDPRTEALLYATDRAYHVATVIRPALANGQTVLEDRYIDSSVAYQGAARQLGAQEIRDLSLWATDGLLPDAVLVFDVDPQVGLSRLGAQRDRLERATDGFHGLVRQHYLEIAAADPERYTVIDANQDIDAVYADAVAALRRIVGLDQ